MKVTINPRHIGNGFGNERSISNAVIKISLSLSASLSLWVSEVEDGERRFSLSLSFPLSLMNGRGRRMFKQNG